MAIKNTVWRRVVFCVHCSGRAANASVLVGGSLGRSGAVRWVEDQAEGVGFRRGTGGDCELGGFSRGDEACRDDDVEQAARVVVESGNGEVLEAHG